MPETGFGTARAVSEAGESGAGTAAPDTKIPCRTSAATTSRYSGSPADPGSLVRSSTVILRTLSGSFSARWRLLKGR